MRKSQKCTKLYIQYSHPKFNHLGIEAIVLGVESFPLNHVSLQRDYKSVTYPINPFKSIHP